MTLWKCPGQDRTFWKPEDIFDYPCPHCGQSIEFWKDDIVLRCHQCKQLVTNPRFNPGCAAWCSYAEKCLGEVAKDIKAQPQIIRNRLEVEVRKKLGQDHQKLFNRLLKLANQAETLALTEKVEPLIAVAASLVGPAAAALGWAEDEILNLLNGAGIEEEKARKILEVIRFQGEREDDPYLKIYCQITQAIKQN